MDIKSIIKDLGGASSVARRLRSKDPELDRDHISVAAVSKWKRVPADRVMDIVAMSGGKLRPEILRPDIFGRQSQRAKAA